MEATHAKSAHGSIISTLLYTEILLYVRLNLWETLLEAGLLTTTLLQGSKLRTCIIIGMPVGHYHNHGNSFACSYQIVQYL